MMLVYNPAKLAVVSDPTVHDPSVHDPEAATPIVWLAACATLAPVYTVCASSRLFEPHTCLKETAYVSPRGCAPPWACGTVLRDGALNDAELRFIGPSLTSR